MTAGRVQLRVADGVASVTFDRPEARNAMTWTMYEALSDACRDIAADKTVRVATFRGAGGEAFVAGTDIRQFTAFQSGEDGVRYERKIDKIIDGIERLAVPTIAVIDGWAVGGGLLIAAACDLRLAAPSAKFGVPIARTLGNCLSMANVARLAAAIGPARARKMLLLAEMIDAEEALASGFVHDIAAPDDLAARTEALCRRLMQHAPLTMAAAKEALRRLSAANIPDGDDLIHKVYGSEDFKTGVTAFLEKKKPQWQGK